MLGLERMRELLERLGRPDRALGQIVHVGGTNGKGSTVAMVAAMARAAGRRVATYTSPHLSTVRERITVDGELVSEAAFVAAAERVTAAGGDALTFFEQLTAIGMLVIADAGVDVSVVEVGLGGRLDATNVVDPAVCVVTGVAMDHEAVLGTTLAAIAGEKAGIWKPGRPAIVGGGGEPDAVPVLVAAAERAGARARTVIRAYDGPLALAGEHQRWNAAAAIAACDELGVRASSALATVTHPGRMERVGDVLLDGAHNPHGAAALARALAGTPVLVLAISADKDAAAMVGALRPAVGHIVATRYQQDRALAPDELARIAGTPHAAPDLASALALARTLGDWIVVAGSLFLVGEARTLLLKAPTDPVVLSDPPAR